MDGWGINYNYSRGRRREMDETKKHNCYECKYRERVAGSAHSCCNYPGTDTELSGFFNPDNKKIAIKLQIEGHPQGIKSGWFMWPVDFDPTWLLNCKGFEMKEEK